MEILSNENIFYIIQNLSTIDIVRLCRTNKFFSSFCNDTFIWKYLLYRDFNINYKKNDAYNKYGRELLKYLGNYFYKKERNIKIGRHRFVYIEKYQYSHIANLFLGTYEESDKLINIFGKNLSISIQEEVINYLKQNNSSYCNLEYLNYLNLETLLFYKNLRLYIDDYDFDGDFMDI